MSSKPALTTGRTQHCRRRVAWFRRWWWIIADQPIAKPARYNTLYVEIVLERLVPYARIHENAWTMLGIFSHRQYRTVCPSVGDQGRIRGGNTNPRLWCPRHEHRPQTQRMDRLMAGLFEAPSDLSQFLWRKLLVFDQELSIAWDCSFEAPSYVISELPSCPETTSWIHNATEEKERWNCLHHGWW